MASKSDDATRAHWARTHIDGDRGERIGTVASTRPTLDEEGRHPLHRRRLFSLGWGK